MLNSCETHRTALRQTTPAAMPQGQEAAHIAAQSYSYWSDQEDSAPLTVRIDLSEQTANFYRNGTKIGRSRVATGRTGHSTSTESFTIMEKVAGKRSNLYGRIFDAEGMVAVMQ